MEGQYELGGHILWPLRGAEARAVALFGEKAGRTTLPQVFHMFAEQFVLPSQAENQFEKCMYCLRKSLLGLRDRAESARSPGKPFPWR